MHPHLFATAKQRLSHRIRRRGSLMVEMVVCTILLSAVAAVVAPGIKAVFEQRKKTRYETLTILELNNQQVKLQAGVEIADLQLSPWFAKRYPDATLNAEPVQVAADEEQMRPIRLSIVRQSDDAGRASRHRLVVWTVDREGTP